MISELFFLVVLLSNQSGQNQSPASMPFAKPSEAFAYANAPMEEWLAAAKSGRPPNTHVAAQAEVWRRAKEICPSFTVENVFGEELYWLAKLCETQPAIGLSAVQRYLAGNGLEHRPEAHLLLSDFQLRMNRSWEGVWETLRIILQEDPFGSDQEARLRVAIEEEADNHEATALKWAEDRYALLQERLRHLKPGVSPISPGWVILAGTDLIHRYYLAGQADRAAAILREINPLKDETHQESSSWASEQLNWAKMEMKLAPPIPVLRPLGSNPGANIVQRGRVELVSFFSFVAHHVSPNWKA